MSEIDFTREPDHEDQPDPEDRDDDPGPTEDTGLCWQEIAGARAERGRRLAVPGGWLYQVELFEDIVNISSDHPNHERRGWHPPVFVPEPRS